MNKYELNYLNLLSDVLSNGKKSSNRTGIDTRKVWGRQIHIDLSQGFPLLTTKKMHWKSVVHELLWMISGDTNIQYLLKNGVTFWSEWPLQEYNKRRAEGRGFPIDQKEFEKTIINDDEFAKRWGSIGKYGYGGLWRKFPYHYYEMIEDKFGPDWRDDLGHIDQLTNVINELKSNPDSRRIIISAWHPYHSNRKEDALLPACHNYIQFGTEELNREERRALLHIRLNLDERPRCAEAPVEQICDNFNIPKYRLNCYYNMRSSDIFLGLPFNCAFYSLLTHLIANQLNMIPGEVVYSAADVHLYENHVEQANVQLKRTVGDLPKISIKTKGKSIFDIKYEDIELIDYNPQPAIKADVAV